LLDGLLDAIDRRIGDSKRSFRLPDVVLGGVAVGPTRFLHSLSVFAEEFEGYSPW
jgi:hypothetical protein